MSRKRRQPILDLLLISVGTALLFLSAQKFAVQYYTTPVIPDMEVLTASGDNDLSLTTINNSIEAVQEAQRIDPSWRFLYVVHGALLQQFEFHSVLERIGVSVPDANIVSDEAFIAELEKFAGEQQPEEPAVIISPDSSALIGEQYVKGIMRAPATVTGWLSLAELTVQQELVDQAKAYALVSSSLAPYNLVAARRRVEVLMPLLNSASVEVADSLRRDVALLWDLGKQRVAIARLYFRADEVGKNFVSEVVSGFGEKDVQELRDQVDAIRERIEREDRIRQERDRRRN